MKQIEHIKHYWPLWLCVAAFAALGIRQLCQGDWHSAVLFAILAAYNIMLISVLHTLRKAREHASGWRALALEELESVRELTEILHKLNDRLYGQKPQGAESVGRQLEEDGTM